MSRFVFLILFISQWAQASGLGANDVSFLFPLSTGEPYPSINMVEENGLISQNVFKQVLQFEHQVDDLKKLPYIDVRFLIDPRRWFVTSFRYDDCGDSFHTTPVQDKSVEIFLLKPTGACQARLRVVVQPFNFSDQPLPTALHLIYQLSAKERQEVLKQLLAIKDLSPVELQTSRLPLMTHPGLTYELQKGSLGPIGSALKKLLQQNATKLEVVTLTLNTTVMQWRMVGGYVRNQTWTRFVTEFSSGLYDTKEALPLGVESIRCNFDHYCISGPQNAEAEERRLLTTMFRALPDGSPPPPEYSQETEILAEDIDSVEKTQFFNTNCMSCHQSTNFRNRSKIVTKLDVAEGVTPFTLGALMGTSPSHIFNFGYEGLNTRISLRTAAESAEVARQLNQLLKLDPPGYKPKNLSQFWNCLVNEEKFLDCFQL